MVINTTTLTKKLSNIVSTSVEDTINPERQLTISLRAGIISFKKGEPTVSESRCRQMSLHNGMTAVGLGPAEETRCGRDETGHARSSSGDADLGGVGREVERHAVRDEFREKRPPARAVLSSDSRSDAGSDGVHHVQPAERRVHDKRVHEQVADELEGACVG